MIDTIPLDVQYQIQFFLQGTVYDPKENYSNWATYSRTKLCALLEKAYQSLAHSGKSKLNDQIEEVKWPHGIMNRWHVYAGEVQRLVTSTSDSYNERTIVQTIRKSLENYCNKHPLDLDSAYIKQEWEKIKVNVTTIKQVLSETVPDLINFLKTSKENADKIGYGKGEYLPDKTIKKEHDSKKHKEKGHHKNPSGSNPTLKAESAPKPDDPRVYCPGCGRSHVGGFTACNHKEHEHFNKNRDVRYEKSTVGTALAKQLNRSIVFKIPLGETPKQHGGRDTKPDGANKRHKGNEVHKTSDSSTIFGYVNSINICKPNAIHKLISNVTVPCIVLCREQVKDAEPKGIDAVSLLDTGADTSSYINQHLSDQLVAMGSIIQPCNTTICSSIGTNLCVACLGSIEVVFKFKNQITNEFEFIKITTKIIKMSTDIIIGNRDIYSYEPNLIDRYSIRTDTSKPHTASALHGVAQTTAPTYEELRSNNDGEQTGVDTVLYLNPLDQLEHDFEYQLSIEDDYDKIAWSQVPLAGNNRNDDFPTIEGTEALQLKLSDLCSEYKDIFSKELRREPANIPPFELVVNVEKWQKPENHQPPRKVSMIKDSEIKRQVDSMIAANVVEESQAPYYSQVLLTPKPNNEWRFCIDYRRLNDASTKLGWPIPNIQQMLRRIGETKSKIFAKIDFTKGYYQAPLSMSSRILTAFICFCGVYQWLRVPMGLKGAPSYFQKEMATLVLGGLIHIILELYIDDILIHGRTEEEFIERVKLVFDRLRKHKITVNPKKCFFGASRIEFVGHEINEEGMKFSEEKIRKVIDFALPITSKQLQGFLGLANYFRDHIEGFSTRSTPLFQVLIHWNKTNRFIWTKEADIAFRHMKDAINRCPQLFFVSETGLVYLYTDASKHGVGGYLFQIVDGVEQPIQFVSKAFTGPQLNWDTYKKEAYAIVYCIKKLEYLLRDVEFLLRTDHRNLTYISEAGTPIVSRWKQQLQEFNFKIDYIPGKENIAADGFSRLLTTEDNIEKINCIIEPAKALSRVFHETIEIVNNIESTIRIPNDMYRLIASKHNSLVGHKGIDKTIAALKDDNHQWPLMRQHVKQFVKHCACCQKMSYLKYPIHAHPFTLSTYEPWTRIHIDTVGEMPRKDEAGNLYVLVIRDSFSRFSLLYPIPDTSAKHAVKCFIHMFGLFGSPAQILSDNGSQFVNEIITEFLKYAQVEHLRTMAYSKEENGLVERANKEVNRYLRDLIYDLRVDATWSDYLPMIQRILNSTVNKSTGLTPAEIIFGNSIDLDRGMLHPLTVNEQPVVVSHWMANMLTKQTKLISLAQTKLKIKDDKHIQEYDPKRTEFAINSYVLVSYPVGLNGTRKPPTRFHPILKGPYRVIKSVGSKYTVQNLVTYKHEEYNSTQLRPFNYDPERVNLQDVASRDKKEFIIDHIVSHTGDFKSKKTLQFLVKWLGYEDSENSYEPWKELKNTEQLHAYLIRSGLQAQIPKEFRRDYQLD
jgi:transposase InsO family protein